MNKDQLQTISTRLVTLALLLFAYQLLQKAFEIADKGGVEPELLVQGVMTLATAIIMAAVARWLQQGAQQAAEQQAVKLQEAVATAANGSSPASVTTETVDVTAQTATLTETDGGQGGRDA